MSSDLKNVLRKLEYPDCAKETLSRIESLAIHRNKQDFVADLTAEFIFLEKNRDDNRKNSGRTSTSPVSMSLLQEFQLVIILCEFFSNPGPDVTRNALFFSLFGGNITPNRISILIKLISTSISGSIAPVLCAAGTWMQQLGCTATQCLELTQSLITDFIIFAKKTSEQFKQLPLIAPRFAANFMTAAAELYMNDVKGVILTPPDMLLEVLTEWVCENPNLCLASQQPLALPTGAIAMPVVTPFVGLIRWSVLCPITGQQTKTTYSKLHLSLLETFLQILPENGNPTTVNAQQLGLIVNPLKSHVRKLINEGINPENDENFQSSLDRFAMAVQVAIASKCVYGNLAQLLCLLETLPANKLMNIVIKANKIS